MKFYLEKILGVCEGSLKYKLQGAENIMQQRKTVYIYFNLSLHI